MGTNTKVEWKKLKNANADSDSQLIRLNPNTVRSRSQLLSVLAHEMKHVRDRPLWAARYKQSGLLREENKNLSRQSETLRGEPLNRLRQRMNVNRRVIDRELQLDSSDASEIRANRAGAFALGRLGKALDPYYLELPNDPSYADRDHLIWANANGYALGAKVAFLKSAGYRALPKSERLLARQRINHYLGGYATFIERQALEAYSDQPDLSFRAPPISVRVDGLREQRSAHLGTPEELFSAGFYDAWRGLTPQGRFSQLLADK